MVQQPAISLIAPSFQRVFHLPEGVSLAHPGTCAIMVIDICWNILLVWPWAAHLIYNFCQESVRRPARGRGVRRWGGPLFNGAYTQLHQ